MGGSIVVVVGWGRGEWYWGKISGGRRIWRMVLASATPLHCWIEIGRIHWTVPIGHGYGRKIIYHAIEGLVHKER